MKLERPQRRKLTNILLSLPATLVWVPLCGFFLPVLGVATASVAYRMIVSSDLPVRAIAVTASGFALCVGGLLGIFALWAMILRWDVVDAAGSLPWRLLRAGLWIGFATGLFALAFSGYVLWQEGFNPSHVCFALVLGPMIVFLRETRHLQPVSTVP